MNVLEARVISFAVREQIRKELEAKNKRFREDEEKKLQRHWKLRGPTLIAQIEGYIKKAAEKGENGTWEPTRSNPNGDSIIYLEKEDEPLKKLLMAHFEGKGFSIQDYMYGGFKVTW